MQEKWNQFVFDLIESKRKNIEEESYHVLIENQMQLIGWAKYRKEILHKLNVPIGRSFIQPDILVEKDGEVQFVIEVKRPVYKQTPKDVNQLQSYIRQLKKKVGIYIGEYIEIFYDRPEEKDVVSIMTIPLELDNKRGARFVDLFSREKFNEKSIVDFCEECIEEKHRQESLNKIKDRLISDVQPQVVEALIPYLVEKYNGTFAEDEIQEMLSSIHFSAVAKEREQAAKQKFAAHKESVEHPQQDLRERDIKYAINGGEFHYKNIFVHLVVKEYVRLHPEKTYAELEQIFQPKLQGSFGTIRTLNYIHSKKYKGKRYFTEKERILKSNDGIMFAVSTQWSKENLPQFLEVAKDLGFSIVSSEEEQPLLHGQQNMPQQGMQIPCRITRGGIDAQGVFYPNNKSLIVLQGSRINISHSPSFQGAYLENRKAQITQHAEERNGNLYVKENIRFETPSGAATFCVGGSSNGWRDWKDEQGNELTKYRQ